MIKILNLYAGIGGNRKLWKDVEVTAVENNSEVAKIYQDFFLEDKVIVGDAHQYLLDHYKEFDFIWSSPPCQTHSKWAKVNHFRKDRKPKYPDLRLWQEIIFLQQLAPRGLKWVVENVDPYYGAFIYGKKVNRHLFWSNFLISNIELPKRKDLDKITKNQLAKWLGIPVVKTILLTNHEPRQLYRNCVHPKLGLHIFNCAFKEQQIELDLDSYCNEDQIKWPKIKGAI